CIETGGQVSRHRSLPPSFLGRESFAPPLAKGMIEYHHRDQILAFLLPASHSRRKFIEGPMALCGGCGRGLLPRKRARICGLMMRWPSQRVAEKDSPAPQTG